MVLDLDPKTLERLKAERTSFRISPPTTQQLEDGVLDISVSYIILSQAMRELAEAIPNGQLERTQVFLARAKMGIKALEDFLIIQGVKIDPLRT